MLSNEQDQERYTEASFNKALDENTLTFPERVVSIELKSPTAEPRFGIRAANWIPLPLEIASSDRETNAITALLGWTLLEETTEDIVRVAPGAGELALEQIERSLDNWNQAALSTEIGEQTPAPHVGEQPNPTED